MNCGTTTCATRRTGAANRRERHGKRWPHCSDAQSTDISASYRLCNSANKTPGSSNQQHTSCACLPVVILAILTSAGPNLPARMNSWQCTSTQLHRHRALVQPELRPYVRTRSFAKCLGSGRALASMRISTPLLKARRHFINAGGQDGLFMGEGLEAVCCLSVLQVGSTA